MATIPNTFRIADATCTNNSNMLSSESRSLIIRNRKVPGQRFEFRIESVQYDLKEAKPILGFFHGIKQTMDTVTFQFPILSESDVGTKTVSGAVTKGVSKVNVTNATGMVTGDYFTFGNHLKAYVVTDVNSNEVTFAPSLVVDVPDATIMKFDGVEFTCHILRGPFSYDVDSSSQVEIGLDLVEAL